MSRGPPGLDRWFDIDPYLQNYRHAIVERFLRFNTFRKKLAPNKDLQLATGAYKYFGIHIDRNTGYVTAREWAPAASGLYLAGDFNCWNRCSHPFQKVTGPYGEIWECTLPPDAEGKSVLKHLSEIKIIVATWEGDLVDRLSPWATYAEAPLITSGTQYRQKVWYPPPEKVYEFCYPKPKKPRNLKIYECHIGIATGILHEGLEIGSYKNFTRLILPRIKDNGYNAIQMMAVMEHAYYASFGYQVTNFYAVSSRYGTPEDLKELIDKAHSMNLYVLLDIVHSHASSNVADGLNEFDGTKGCFFYDDARGYHSLWGSRMFNTNDMNVLRFLISNACWFVDEYHFDGFRFDGITAMLYKSRGIDQAFSGHYDEYFGDQVDPNGVLYCQLVNYFLHKKYANMITIAEEVSGMPGTCRPNYEGGLGFDYRLAMAIPDKWIKLLKTKRDEEWDMADLVWTHSNRRHKERHVAYCESHDQALVGDKTISFWLMDEKMYYQMKRKVVHNVVIDRGIALHKIIRLFTHALGGEAYLNFIGNEFGHPEWLDFPREGNSWSYHYCRRQWKLVDDSQLLYWNLNEFDKAMNIAEEKYGWLNSPEAYVSLKHEDDKIVVFERANLIFVFNFHVTKSFSDYMIGVNIPGEYQCILSSDDREFAGHERVDSRIHFWTTEMPYCNRSHSMKIYIPNRAALVLARSSEVLQREQDYYKSMAKRVAEITIYAMNMKYLYEDSTSSTNTSKALSEEQLNTSKAGTIIEDTSGEVPERDTTTSSDLSTAFSVNGPLASSSTPSLVLSDGKQPQEEEVSPPRSTGNPLDDTQADSFSSTYETVADVMEVVEVLLQPVGEGGDAQHGAASVDSGSEPTRSSCSLGTGSYESAPSVRPKSSITGSSDPSTSKYDTASSASGSGFKTPNDMSDIMTDMDVWGKYALSNKNSDAWLRNAVQILAVDTDEFEDTFEDFEDDETE